MSPTTVALLTDIAARTGTVRTTPTSSRWAVLRGRAARFAPVVVRVLLWAVLAVLVVHVDGDGAVSLTGLARTSIGADGFQVGTAFGEVNYWPGEDGWSFCPVGWSDVQCGA